MRARGVLSISGRLLAGGGRRAVLDLGLSAAGVAISVAITVLVVGGISGLELRADRTAWRDPLFGAPGVDGTVVDGTGTASQPIALQQRTAERFADTTVEVVRLHRLTAGAGAPPGLAAIPADGEILASPALEALLSGPQGELLRARLGDRVSGTLPPEALAHEGEAVAVVGDGSLVVTPAEEVPPYDYRIMGAYEPSPVAAVADFTGSGAPGRQHGLYQQLFALAGVLLVAPSVLLLGAAARFTAARRARRLAGLRLAGASPGQITGIAALESLAGASAGAVLGLALAAVGRAAVAGVPLAGGPFGRADLVPQPGVTAIVVLVALAVALVATLAGLRAVRASPLGVVRSIGDRRPSVLRVVAMLAVFGLFGMTGLLVGGGATVFLLVAGLALVIGSVSLGGPWFTWLIGWVTARRSRRLTPLLAARAMTSDPIGAFRPATPLVFSAFVGGFLLVVTGTSAVLGVPAGGSGVLTIPRDLDVAPVETALAEAGVPAAVAAGEFGGVDVQPADPADLEAARTAVDPLADPHVPVTTDDQDAETAAILGDLSRGVWLVLVMALVQAAGATGVGAAATVLEQGQTLAALRLAGMETTRMWRVRLLHAALPVGVIATICTALGAGAAIVIAKATGPEWLPVGIGGLLGPPGVVLAAILSAAGGAALSWPVLRSVTTHPLGDA